MAKNTQLFNLYNMLKAVKLLGVKESSVPVYFCYLKKQFKAELETVRNGRFIVAYKLMNADKITVPQYRKAARKATSKVTKVVAKKTAKVVPTKATKKPLVKKNDTDLDTDLIINEITDREFHDIKSTLGLD